MNNPFVMVYEIELQRDYSWLSHSHTHISVCICKVVVMLGDVSVGKTCLVKRLVNEDLPRRSAPTVGIEYVNKVFEMKDGGRLMTQIWDTAGQEKYKAICMHHYKNAVGAIIIYDITRLKTFENCENWMTDFKMQANEKAKIVLFGNKLDVVETEPNMRRVEKSTAQEWATKHDLLFFEGSVMKNRNVYESIETLLEGRHAVK